MIKTANIINVNLPNSNVIHGATRGPDYSVRAELKEMVANATLNTADYSFRDVLKSVKKREFIIPFFMLLFLVTVQGK